MKTLFWLVAAIIAFGPAVRAESRSERREREMAESAKPQQVSGGAFFATHRKYDAVYDRILNYLKLQGKTIEAASKETGQIFTAIEVKGGWRQTGTRIVVTVVKDGDEGSSVRAIVTEQKRFKALQVEPWSDPVVEPKASAALQEQLKAALAAD